MQTGGVTLTAQQPLNNIVRVALQTFATALGGHQSLHTNSYDEALCLPTQGAVTVDPLAGSYYVEYLTDKIEAEIFDYIKKIDAMGGTLTAIEQGYIQKEIQNSAYLFQKSIDSGERAYVGVNKYTMEEPPVTDLLRVDMKVGEEKTAELKQWRAKRDKAAWQKALDKLRDVSKTDTNVMPTVIEAVKAGATVGEVCDVWREVFGQYRPKEFIS